MPHRRYSPVTILLAVALVAATFFGTRAYSLSELKGVAWFGTDGWRELAPIASTYGPSRHSRNTEEWLIRDFFQDRRSGVFVDVGANHYRDESNTYFLETQLGWSGVAVDALEAFAADYRVHRPRTQYFARFVSDGPMPRRSSTCPRRTRWWRQPASSSRSARVLRALLMRSAPRHSTRCSNGWG